MNIGKKKNTQGPWQSRKVQWMNTLIPLKRNSGDYSLLKKRKKRTSLNSINQRKNNRSFNHQSQSINGYSPKKRSVYNENSYIGDRLSREFGVNKDELKDKKQIVFIHKGMSPNHILVNDKNNEKDIKIVDDNDYETVVLNAIKAQNGDIDIKFLQHGQKGTSKGDITRDDISMSKVVDVSIEKACNNESCKNITISNVQCYGNIRAVWDNLTSKMKDLKYLRGKKFVIRIGDDRYSGWADSRNRSNFIKGISGAIYRRNILEIEIDNNGKQRVLLNYVDVTKDFENKCSFDELRKNHANYESNGKIGSAVDPIRIIQSDGKYDDEYVAYALRKFYVKDKNSIAKTVEEIRSRSSLLSDKAKRIVFDKDADTKAGFKNIIKQLSHRSLKMLKSSRPGRSGRYFE